MVEAILLSEGSVGVGGLENQVLRRGRLVRAGEGLGADLDDDDSAQKNTSCTGRSNAALMRIAKSRLGRWSPRSRAPIVCTCAPLSSAKCRRDSPCLRRRSRTTFPMRRAGPFRDIQLF